MALTKTQKDWANEQLNKEAAAVLTGTVTNRRGEPGEYVLEVVGDDGTGEFVLFTDDEEFAEKHLGDTSSIRIEGTVTSVELDEENGRVGLVVSGDNGTVTQWTTPEMSPEEIEAIRPLPPTPEEEQAQQEANRQEEFNRRREELLALLKDPAIQSEIRKASAAR